EDGQRRFPRLSRGRDHLFRDGRGRQRQKDRDSAPRFVGNKRRTADGQISNGLAEIRQQSGDHRAACHRTLHTRGNARAVSRSFLQILYSLVKRRAPATNGRRLLKSSLLCASAFSGFFSPRVLSARLLSHPARFCILEKLRRVGIHGKLFRNRTRDHKPKNDSRTAKTPTAPEPAGHEEDGNSRGIQEEIQAPREGSKAGTSAAERRCDHRRGKSTCGHSPKGGASGWSPQRAAPSRSGVATAKNCSTSRLMTVSSPYRFAPLTRSRPV